MLFANGMDLSAGTDLEVEAIDAEGMKSKPRKVRPKKLIIDWSGCEMTGEDYAAFLGRGTTGTHLFIDYDGIIWQYADLFDQVKRHAGVDEDSIWIVIQNKGAPPEDLHYRRGTFQMELDGKKLGVLSSTTEQMDSLESLLELLCASFLIEPTIPRQDGVPIKTMLETDTLKTWQGILLASNLNARTLSPGPGVVGFLDEIDEEFHAKEEDETDEEFEDLELDPDAFDKAFPDP